MRLPDVLLGVNGESRIPPVPETPVMPAPPHLSQRKTALVISGGGAMGAFAVGVVHQIYADFRPTGWFQIVGGSSTGALISPLAGLLAAPEPLAGQALETLVNEYTRVSTHDILHKRNVLELILHRDGLNSSLPLRARLHHVFRAEWFDWLRSPEAPTCYVVYINYRSGERVVVSPKDPGMTRERFVLSILASSSVPVLMDPTIIDGDACYDGGVRDIIPLGPAISLGAETIVPVFLDADTFSLSHNRFARIDSVLFRTLAILLDENEKREHENARLLSIACRLREEVLQASSDDLGWSQIVKEILGRGEYADLLGPEKRLRTVVEGLRPDTPLTEDALRFDPAQMRRWMQMGERKAREILTVSPFAG